MTSLRSWAGVKELSRRCRPWFVAVMVLLGLLSPLFPPEFRYVPLTALLGVVAQALLEVLGQLSAPSQKPHVRVVRDVIAGIPQMREGLEECIKHKVGVHIQWIGMTMFNAWNSLEEVLDELAMAGVPRVSVEIAMLTGKWLEENPINPGWTSGQAEYMAAKMRAHFKAPRLRQLGWSLTIYQYNHMPILHGGLISDRYLFLALSSWDDGCLKAGTSLLKCTGTMMAFMRGTE